MDEFTALVERHQRLVVGVALAITRDRALAEDIGQDTFVAAWRGLSTLADRERIAPWLAGIARNLANNTMRKHARRKQPEPDDAVAPSPHDELDAAQRAALVRDALAELPEAQREALVLYYFEDRSVEHVAGGLGVSKDVVKQRLHRARERLGDRLGPALEGMRPGAAFTAGVIAAISLATVTKATAATTSVTGGKLMLTKLAIIAAVLASAGTATVYAVHRARSTTAAPASASAPAPSASAPAPSADDRAKVGTRHATAHVASAPDRAKMVEAIHDSRARRSAGPRPTLPAVASGNDALANYVRDVIEAITPLIRECAERRRAAVPDLPAGRIRVRCTIDSEPDVGAVISSSEIVPDGTTVTDPELLECVRETMYAMEIDQSLISGSMTFETAMAIANSEQAADKL